jgi:hypothetical protein
MPTPKRTSRLLLGIACAAATLAAGYVARRLTTTGDRPLAAEDAGGHEPPRAWSKSFSGRGRVAGVGVDAQGAVFVAGALSGTIDFGGGPLTSAGEDDVFIVKLDAAGQHVWSKRFGGPGYQVPAALAVDAEGAVIVVGTLDQTIDFGGGALTSAGLIDVFVVKLDASGNHVWSKRFGDAAEQEASAVAIAPGSGRVLVAGSFEGTLDFGGGGLTSAGDDDVYLAALDAAGNHLWSKRFGDVRAQKGRALAMAPDGAVALVGQMEGTVDFGGGPLSARDAPQLFAARFDAGGRHLASRTWASEVGGRVDPRAVAWGPRGLVLAGIARGGADLGTGRLLQRGEDDDAVVLSLDPSDGTRFARRWGGTGAVTPRAIGLLDDGGLVLAGQLEGRADFGEQKLASAGRAGAFWVTLDADGKLAGAHVVEGGRQAAACAMLSGGDVVLGGDLEGAGKAPGVFVARLATR